MEPVPGDHRQRGRVLEHATGLFQPRNSNVYYASPPSNL